MLNLNDSFGLTPPLSARVGLHRAVPYSTMICPYIQGCGVQM
jgi:hypothetical protein